MLNRMIWHLAAVLLDALYLSQLLSQLGCLWHIQGPCAQSISPSLASWAALPLFRLQSWACRRPYESAAVSMQFPTTDRPFFSGLGCLLRPRTRVSTDCVSVEPCRRTGSEALSSAYCFSSWPEALGQVRCDDFWRSGIRRSRPWLKGGLCCFSLQSAITTLGRYWVPVLPGRFSAPTRLTLRAFRYS